MFKFAKLENSGAKDPELGRELYITTSARKYFRDNLSSSPELLALDVPGSESVRFSNEELNNIIAKYVINSQFIKNIKTKDGWGLIRYNQSLSVYFIISYDNTYAKVISVKNKINTESRSSGQGMYPSMISSGIIDPIRNLEIRVSTTARIAMKKAFPYRLIEKILTEGASSEGSQVTVSEANPLELTKFIAKVLAENGKENKIKTTFKTNSGEKAEIRGVGMTNLVFVSIIRDTMDIVSVQDSWRSDKVPRPGQKGRREVLTVNREGFKGGRV
jgi:hypothetical protein